MPTIENYTTYAPWAFEVIRHIFAFTAAIFLCGLVYFLLTVRQSSPQYRLSAVISAVVMISAALEIGQLWLLFNDSFVYDPALQVWVAAEGEVFSNGYRYVNWLIDVPMLMTQLAVVCGIAGSALVKRWGLLTFLGAGMIITGYVGQFFESPAAGVVDGDASQFWIWGAVSTVFFIALLLVLAKMVQNPIGEASDRVRSQLKFCFWFLVATWAIYPFGYLWPVIDASDGGVVTRQVLYTVADVTSKLVFGGILSYVAIRRSAEVGYEPAIEQLPDLNGSTTVDRSAAPAARI